MGCRPDDAFLFFRRDGFKRASVVIAAAKSDFNEYDVFTVIHYEVDFPHAAPVVTADCP